MNLTTTNLNINKAFTDIYDILSAASLDELNIYNQAYLELNQPLIKNVVFHKNTKYELPILFNIDGDLSGQIICLLDSYNKNIKEEEKDFFMSLYVESMNILVGKMLTNIEEKFSLGCLLSSPIRPRDSFLENYNAKKVNLLSMGYKLISNSVEYDCRILFKINKKQSIEV